MDQGANGTGRHDAFFLDLIWIVSWPFQSVSIHHGSWTNSHAGDGNSALHHRYLNPSFHACQSICHAAARTVVRLVQNLDRINPFDRKQHDMVRWKGMIFAGEWPSMSSLDCWTYVKLKRAWVQFHIRTTSKQPPTLTQKLFDTIYLYLHTIWLSIFMRLSMEIFRELGNIAVNFVVKTSPRNTRETKRAYQNQDDRPEDGGASRRR